MTLEGRPIAIVGAGSMGRGIAYVAATREIDVHLVDVEEEQLRDAMEQIERDLEEGVERDKVSEELAAEAPKRISTGTDIAAACEGVGLVVEAVVERMDVKHDVFRQMESGAPEDAVLATNTSALSITEIIAVLDDPSRGVGMHFFNPVPKMKLCELVRGLQTSDETMDAAAAAAEALGKTPVRVTDAPGFATSRLNALLGNEAMRMVEEGVATPEDIDTAVKLGLNHPMGPLEMVDLVGLDVRIDILEHLAETLGERFRPTNLQRRLVSAKRLGRKSGRGVYRYDDNGKRVDEPSDLGRQPG